MSKAKNTTKQYVQTIVEEKSFGISLLKSFLFFAIREYDTQKVVCFSPRKESNSFLRLIYPRPELYI